MRTSGTELVRFSGSVLKVFILKERQVTHSMCEMIFVRNLGTFRNTRLLCPGGMDCRVVWV